VPANIFSTYGTFENRVTAAILAVLQSLSLGRIDRLLNALLQSTEFELVRFENQVSKGGAGVPDARILSSNCILIETKTAKNAVSIEQLRRHLERLNHSPEAVTKLIVLTPDDQQPVEITEIDDPRLAWVAFSVLDQAIEELLQDRHEVTSEREAFLLKELQAMLQRERLVGATNDVLVVAAREAWPEYRKYHAYICQPERSFQNTKWFAFYSEGEVKPCVPRILEVHEDVELTPDHLSGNLRDLAIALIIETSRQSGMHYKIMFLSAPEADETSTLQTQFQTISRQRQADRGLSC
jgi:hypothetical protein